MAFLIFVLGMPTGYYMLHLTMYYFAESDFWESIAGIISIFFTIGAIFFIKRQMSYMECKYERENFRHTLFWVPVVILTATFALMMAGGNLYTMAFGKAYSAEIIALQKRPGDTKRCLGGIRIRSPHLHKVLDKAVCVDKDFAKSFKNKDFLEISGKESFFGRTISGYSIVEKSLTERTRERLDTANRFWGIEVPCSGKIC